MYRSVYIDREDAKVVEEEERNFFVRDILNQIGVPLVDVWPDILLTVEQKISLRNLLSKLEIEIIDDGDRGCEIYCKDILLGKWNKPKFILRENKTARTLNKRLFFEMVVNTSSVFDKENENDQNNTD